jgi:hypothetical protein
MSDESSTLTLDLPPFPPLTCADFFWEGEDRFPEWDGFRNRAEMFPPDDPEAEPPRMVAVNVVPADANVPTPPSAEQIAAYAHLKTAGPAVAAAVLTALLAEYPSWRDSYGYDDEEAEELMPEVTRPEDFRPLIGLIKVHVLNVAKDGVAYVGLQFDCAWDEEHGLGAMTHRGRVVKLGGADTSFLEWVAKQDGGQPLS